MEIGIFARTFEAPSLAGVLDAVSAHGIRYIQFNTSCMGLSDMPDGLDAAASERARREIDTRAIEVVSLSATYNMIHPDRQHVPRAYAVWVCWPPTPPNWAPTC